MGHLSIVLPRGGRNATSTMTAVGAFASFMTFVGSASRAHLDVLVVLVYVVGVGVLGRAAREFALRRAPLFPARAESLAVLDTLGGVGILVVVNQVLVISHASSTARRVAVASLLAVAAATRHRYRRRQRSAPSMPATEATDAKRAVIGIVGIATAGWGMLILEPLVSLAGIAVLVASHSARVRAVVTLPTSLGAATVAGLGIAVTTGPLSTGMADAPYVAAIAQAISADTPLRHPFAAGATYSYHSLGYLVVGLFTEVGGLDPSFVIHVVIPVLATLFTVVLLWEIASTSTRETTAPDSVVPVVVGLTAVSGAVWTNSLTQLLSYPLLALAIGVAVASGRDTSAPVNAMRVAVAAGLVGVKGPIGIAVGGAFAAQLIIARGRDGLATRWRSAVMVAGGAVVAYAAFFGIGRLSAVPVEYRPQFSTFGFMSQSEFVVDGRVTGWAGIVGLLGIVVAATTSVVVRAKTAVGARVGDATPTGGASVWFAVALLGCVIPYVFVTEVSPPVTISTYFLLHAGLIAWVAGIYEPRTMTALARLPRAAWLALVVGGVGGQAVVSAIESVLPPAAAAARALRAGGGAWVAVVAALVCAVPRVRRSSALGAYVAVTGLLSVGVFLHTRSADFGQDRPIAAESDLQSSYSMITRYFATTESRATIVATNRVCEPAELSCNPDGDPLISLAARRQMYIEGTGHVTTVRSSGAVARWVSQRVSLSRAMVADDGAAACRALKAAGVTHYVLDLRVTSVPRVAPCLVLEAQSEEFRIFRLQ